MNSIQKIYNLQDLRKILSSDFLKIGLFGGSFNPAHVGHLEMSKYAINNFGYDYVIWLVTEQNPLKPVYINTIEHRARTACSIVDGYEKILISTIESEIESNNTYETLRFFIAHFPNIVFTWLMGVDCIKQFHLWENFDKFLDIIQIAIFSRPGYQEYTKYEAYKELLKKHKYPVIFCDNEMIDISSTAIRNANKMINSLDELKNFIIQILDDKKAENITVIDVESKSQLTKYMVIASGRSVKHISALAEYVSLELKHKSSFKTIVEGGNGSGWVLIDAGDIIVHLFHPEARELYKIESLWAQKG